jgi:putative addiction module component (TIGR02574 family)
MYRTLPISKDQRALGVLYDPAIRLYIQSMNSITVADLLHLSIPERLQLVEDLWDSIAAEAAAEPERLPVDSSLRQELRRRSEAYRNNPHEAIPLDEALDEIGRSLG